METCRQAVELFQVDILTNMTKLTVAFLNFEYVPKQVFKHFTFNFLIQFSCIQYTTNEFLPHTKDIHSLQYGDQEVYAV
jgi:hypothetical protein